VVEIKNGSLQLYLGTYAEYLEKAEKALEAERKEDATARQKKTSAPHAKPTEKEKEQAKKTLSAKKDKKRIEEVEHKINRLEQQKESLLILFSEN